MTDSSSAISESRVPLNRQRVLDAAVALADDEGLDALTMRRLAKRLGVEAMSLYYHIASKSVLLDGLADVVVAEINQEVAGIGESDPKEDWTTAMRIRILAARKVMMRHRWASRVLDTRTVMSPALLHYYDQLLEVLRAGGVSWDLAHHSLHALGSRALGFGSELFQPSSSHDKKASDEMLSRMADELPLMVGMLSELVDEDSEKTDWCDDQTEFEFGLDLLLEGIERRRQQQSQTTPQTGESP